MLYVNSYRFFKAMFFIFVFFVSKIRVFWEKVMREKKERKKKVEVFSFWSNSSSLLDFLFLRSVLSLSPLPSLSSSLFLPPLLFSFEDCLLIPRFQPFFFFNTHISSSSFQFLTLLYFIREFFLPSLTDGTRKKKKEEEQKIHSWANLIITYSYYF